MPEDPSGRGPTAASSDGFQPLATIFKATSLRRAAPLPEVGGEMLREAAQRSAGGDPNQQRRAQLEG